MTAIGMALLVFGCAFGGSLGGMCLRGLLPGHHLGDDSKELIHLCMGLIATMTALILGLVTASAKNAYDAQDSAVKSQATSVLTLDRTLASYGPEAKPIREDIRRALIRGIDTLWRIEPAELQLPSDVNPTATADRIERAILELSPQSDAQRWLQSQALAIASDALKTRWMSFAGAGAVVPPAFLAVIVFWLSVLFWSFGLFAPRNAMVIGVLLLSAASVAASVFLILEMQSPFDGMMKVSSAPLQFALAHLGR